MIVNPHRFSQKMIGSVVIPSSTKNASLQTALIVVVAPSRPLNPKFQKNSYIFRDVAFYVDIFVQGDFSFWSIRKLQPTPPPFFLVRDTKGSDCGCGSTSPSATQSALVPSSSGPSSMPSVCPSHRLGGGHSENANEWRSSGNVLSKYFEFLYLYFFEMGFPSHHFIAENSPKFSPAVREPQKKTPHSLAAVSPHPWLRTNNNIRREKR